MKRFINILTGALLSASGAQAFCSEPSFYESPPSVPFGGPPDTPYCMTGFSYSRTHTCDEWEVRNYISEVESYIDDLNNYVAEYLEFANSAASAYETALAYAECSAAEATEELR